MCLCVCLTGEGIVDAVVQCDLVAMFGGRWLRLPPARPIAGWRVARRLQDPGRCAQQPPPELSHWCNQVCQKDAWYVHLSSWYLKTADRLVGWLATILTVTQFNILKVERLKQMLPNSTRRLYSNINVWTIFHFATLQRSTKVNDINLQEAVKKNSKQLTDRLEKPAAGWGIEICSDKGKILVNNIESRSSAMLSTNIWTYGWMGKKRWNEWTS